MGTGYTRNDVSNNIANGNVINASDLDGEFDAIVAAFDSATGHTHDGTTAEGAPIEVLGPGQEVLITSTTLEPDTTNSVDIGTATKQFKDAYFDGTVDTDGLTVTGTATFSGATISDLGTITTADIDGGTIDGTVIGGASAAAGTFTTLTVNTSSTIDLSNNTSAGDLAIADGGTGASTASAARTNLGLEIGTDVQAYDAGLADIAGLAVTDGNFIVGDGANWVAESGATVRTSLGLGSIATQDANSIAVTGGTIDGVTIGGSTPAAGTFTTFTSTGIDDNTTGETLQLADTIANVGQSGLAFTIARNVNDQALFLSAGGNNSQGASIHMYGGAHSSLASDLQFKRNTTLTYQMDGATGDHVWYQDDGSTALLTLDASTGNATFSNDLFVSSTNAGSANRLIVQNSGNIGGSDAVLYVRTAGNSSGDPVAWFSVDGVQTWAIGTDNSDGNKFKISNGTSLGTSDVLEIDTSRNATFNNDLTVSGAFTSVGIDDNATGERLQISDTNVTYGAAGTSYSFLNTADDQLTILSGGNASNSGANIVLYGGSHPGASDFNIRRGSTITYLMDGATGDHTWYQDDGATVGIKFDASTGNAAIGTTATGTYRLRVDSTAQSLYLQNTNSGNNVSDWAATNASYGASMHQMNVNRAASSAYNYGVYYSSSGTDTEFKFRGDGTALCDGSFTGGGADYAEYFEWSDGNTGAEDRVGYSVVLDGNMIRKATSNDAAIDVIGVVSGNPSVVGDNDMQWRGKYLTDDFGRRILEEFTVTEWTETIEDEDEEGNVTTKEKFHSYASDQIPDGVVVPDDAIVLSTDDSGNALTREKINPEFNPTLEHVSREERPEWAIIGLMGKLRLRKGQPVGDRWIKMRDISSDVEEWLVR